MKRRQFLQTSAATWVAAIANPVSALPVETTTPPAFELDELTIADLQQGLQSGKYSSRELVEKYTDRINDIDKKGPALYSLIELNPDAEKIATALDRERKEKGPRSPLHGIPILIKDNIDTQDRMMTTAGSLALEAAKPLQDAFVARKLREAGAVILGKTNLCAAAIGTETDGSIVCPSSANSLVGIKPTLGMISGAGIVPIAHSQDTAGPMARTVADAAVLLACLAGTANAPDQATIANFTKALDKDGLKGVRLGIARKQFGFNEHVDKLMTDLLAEMKKLGAVLVDPSDIPTSGKFDDSEFEVLLYEFKTDLNAYLAKLGPQAPVRSLKDVIEFNEKNRDREMPFFGQDIMEKAQAKGPLTSKPYIQALRKNQLLTRKQGIDFVMQKNRLDALVAPTGGPAWPTDWINGDHFTGGYSSASAVAGYPHITVPAGYVFGLPVGISFFGSANSEPKLIQLAYAFEQATKARRAPKFLEKAV